MRRGFCHLEMFGQDLRRSRSDSAFFAASAAFLSALGGKKLCPQISPSSRRGRREHPHTCNPCYFFGRDSGESQTRSDAAGPRETVPSGVVSVSV